MSRPRPDPPVRHAVPVQSKARAFIGWVVFGAALGVLLVIMGLIQTGRVGPALIGMVFGVVGGAIVGLVKVVWLHLRSGPESA